LSEQAAAHCTDHRGGQKKHGDRFVHVFLPSIRRQPSGRTASPQRWARISVTFDNGRVAGPLHGTTDRSTQLRQALQPGCQLGAFGRRGSVCSYGLQ
jgi:hypothetical protein